MPIANNIPDKLAYSIEEACKASSLGRTTIYSHLTAHRLHSVRVGGRRLIPAESLRAFILGNPNGRASDAAEI